MEEDKKTNNNNNSGKSKLETSKAERSVWLMKTPPAVANLWKNAADNEPISKVVVSLDPLRPDDPASLEFSMEMANHEAGKMPKSYSLNMFKEFVPMSIFSEVNQGKVAVEGKVEHKFDMKPHNKNMEEYSKMCRERTNESMIKNRQIKVIGNNHGVLIWPMPGMVGFIPSNSKGGKDKQRATPVKAPEVKRTRRDRSELEDIMFKLFERRPNWTLKQLIQETDQPAQFLKEILTELCMYNKKGSNQGSYELKPEYKKSVEDTGADAD